MEETEINGTIYEYHSENDGQPFGEKDEYTLSDAVDYFHGDGRAAFRISPYTAFVTEGDEIHLHALPREDEQCPEDAHSCLGTWDVDNFSTMLDGLRVIEIGLDTDSGPEQILNTMRDRMGGLELGAGVEDAGGKSDHVRRIE